MDTSKTGSIKSLLLKAWRERWSDLEWGINIKRVLPRGVSGDIYNLSDCILQQALIGPVPNKLVLSYLQHSLCSEVVSYGAVLSSIENYQLFHKPHCILSLLELLKSLCNQISCHGKADECVFLCKAMVSITSWCYACVFHSIQKLVELKTSFEHQSIIEEACSVLNSFGQSSFYKALLYIGKHDDQASFSKMMKSCQEVVSLIPQLTTAIPLSKEIVESAVNCLMDLENGLNLMNSTNVKQKYKPQVGAVGALVCLEAIMNPTKDVNTFVQQVLLLQRLQALNLSVLYSEVIKSCFMGLIDSLGTSDELKWTAFIFLKVPQVLLKIHLFRNQITEVTNSSDELEEALDMVLESVPLLDCSDTKANCECLQYLLTELSKVSLLSDTQVKKLMLKRQIDSQNGSLTSKTSGTGSQPPQASLILRAEPTVASILKYYKLYDGMHFSKWMQTLDADYSKNQEALLSVLCKMMSGKSFDLILAAAAATGKLQSLAIKLIKFNECSKQSSLEDPKASQIRALLFDISFLMLCHITQQHGSEVVLSSRKTKDSFFETWLMEYFPENGYYKPPDVMLEKTDSSKVDFLLSQFMSSDHDIKTNLVKWHEVCINSPAAIKAVLIAWEHGVISTDNVKVILDTVKTKMCCLPVCISTWLCSFIDISHHDERLKPMNMLQQFMTPYNQENVEPNGDSQINMYYKERSGLLCAIIKKMLYDLHPPHYTNSGRQAKSSPSLVHHALVSKQPYGEIIHDTFQAIHVKGRLDIKSTHMFSNLFNVGGPQNYIFCIMREVLKFEHQVDLYLAVDLAFSLFQIDIEQCALSLFLYFFPQVIYNRSKHATLVEPYGSALAKLTVMVMFSALEIIKSDKVKTNTSNRKRSRTDSIIDDMCELLDDSSTEERPAKFRKVVVHSDMIDVQPTGYQSEDSNEILSSEPLFKAITELFQMFVAIVCEPLSTSCTHFVYTFLEELVNCRRNEIANALQFVPLSLISQMVKSAPDEVSQEVILLLCDNQNVKSRKITAKSLCQLHNCKSKLQPSS